MPTVQQERSSINSRTHIPNVVDGKDEKKAIRGNDMTWSGLLSSQLLDQQSNFRGCTYEGYRGKVYFRVAKTFM